MTKNGRKYYDELPAGMRVAADSDLLNNGRPRVGARYLVRSYHSGLYEEYKISEYVDVAGLGWLRPFIDDGRVWVEA